MAREYVVEFSTEFNEEWFDACYEASKDVLPRCMDIERYRKRFKFKDFKPFLRQMYIDNQKYNDDPTFYKEGVLVSIRDKNTGRILAYYTGEIRRELDALRVNIALYNTDENGSKSWVYDYLNHDISPLGQSVHKLGVSRWYTYVKPGGDIHKALKETKHIVDVLDGSSDTETMRSKHGWDSK